MLLFIVLLTLIWVKADVVEGQFLLDLMVEAVVPLVMILLPIQDSVGLTLILKAARSSKVKASDLAMTGTTLTTSESFFKTTMSMGLRLKK